MSTLRTVRILQEEEEYYFTMESGAILVYTSDHFSSVEECITASLFFLDEMREVEFHQSKGVIFGVLHA